MKKKIFILLLSIISLYSCEKTEYIEEHLYTYDTLYVSEHDSLYVFNQNDCLADEIMNAFLNGNYYLGFFDGTEGCDSVYITDSDKYVNYIKLCFVRQLTLQLKPLTYDYQTGMTTYDTLSYWGIETYNYGNRYLKENPSKIFNGLLSHKFDDIVECKHRDRKYKKDRFSNEETLRDSIIEIHCPHQDLTHKWYFYEYYKQ